MPSMRDQVDAALASARRTGWDGLLDDQREYLDDFWERADVEIDGDDELQQAVRFALFHTLQAARARRAARDPGQGADRAPATTATSSGTPRPSCCPCSPTPRPRPSATRCAGATRRSTSRTERARQLRLEGAAFPWRTIRGQECSAYWPAGTAAFHINADIADAVLRYLHATGDEEFARGAGARAAGARPRGCGARSATTTRAARSTSTASPGPTSTRRSPTTTSTRT